MSKIDAENGRHNLPYSICPFRGRHSRAGSARHQHRRLILPADPQKSESQAVAKAFFLLST